MALCKHCQLESTLAATGEDICPKCGMPYEFSDDDWDFDDAVKARGAAPDETAKEIEESVGEETEMFSGLPDPDATAPAGPTDSENLAGPEAAVDMTHAFGGKFSEDSWDDVEEIALGEEDEDLTAGPADITAPYIDPDNASAGGGSGTAREGAPDTDRLNPDATIAFDSAAAESGDAGAGTGIDPGLGGETIARDAPVTPSGPEVMPPSPPAGPPTPPVSADVLGTLPAGLSGSDRGTDPPPPSAGEQAKTRGEDQDSRGGESGTLAVDSGTNRRSDRVETPKPREITGLESNQTIPRGVMGEDQASQSLRPGDTHVVGPENVRLRAYRLGADEKRGPNDFLIEKGPFQGGMGVVYGMRQGSLDRRVAIKQVKPEMSSSESDRNKFISEAVITGQLEHPNIIPVHDLGLASDGLPFYSMKFVEGDEWEKQIKKLSEDENLSILIQVAQAIAFAHSRGIIHRDLKPGNVMLGEYGEVLVMDWGLAARLENSEGIAPSGTPVYMPPETALQYLDYARGKVGSKQSSTRRVPPGAYSDIYLLGGLLFKIVTGRAPHRGKTTFECLKAAARNEIVKTSKRNELIDIAYKAMRTDPGERHRDVGEFIDEIKAYQAHAQSNKIAKQAYQDLKAAELAKEDPAVGANAAYASYSSAQHGFRNALDLWEGNRRASRRLVETKRKYAETAYDNGDYDLALSLLDPESRDDEKKIVEVRTAQKQRSRRLQWFRTLQYAVGASLIVAIGFIALSVVLGRDAINQRRVADAEKQKAQIAKDEAVAAEAKALAQVAKAEAASARAAEAETKASKADAATRVAETARLAAVKAKTEAEKLARQAGIDAANAERLAAAAAETAAAAQQEAERQQYAAVLNGVRSTLAERGAFAAWTELRAVYDANEDQNLIARGPEWRELLREIDWQADGEAKEVLAGLAAPLVATSSDGSVSVVADNSPAGPRVSVYRDAGFANAVASWRIDAPARLLAVSPDGRSVAVAGKTLALYTIAGQPIAAPDAATLSVTTLAFDPRGDRLLTGDKNTGVALWGIDQGNAAATLISREDQWHRRPITAVGYSPDGRLRFAADAEGRISVWREEQENAAKRWPYSHALASTGSPVITAAAIANRADGGALAYGCRDGAVYVLRGPWVEETQDGQEQSSALPPNPRGAVNQPWVDQRPDKLNTLHAAAVTSVALADSGRVVVSTGGARVLCRRAAANADFSVKPVREYHDSNVLSAAVSADGHALTTDAAGRVVRWLVAAAPNPARLEPVLGDPRGPVTAIGVDPRQAAVVVGDGLGFLRRWDRPFDSRAYNKRFAGHEDHRRMRAWLVDGPTSRVVTVGADRLACVWDAATGALERTLDLQGRHVVTLSADGQSLLAATDLRLTNQAAAIRVPLDGRPTTPLWTDNPRVATLHAFRRPGTEEETVAVGLRDGQLFLWTASGGREELVSSTARPHWRQIRAIAYDAQRDALLAVDNAGLLSRWLLATGGIAQAFLPGDGAARRIEASDGRLLVVRNRLKAASVQIVDTETLKPAAPASFIRDDLTDATFSDGGRSVWAATTKGRIVKWSNARWQSAGLAPAKTQLSSRRGGWTGLRAASNGRVMLFGDGYAELWKRAGRDATLVSRIASRTRPLAAVPAPRGGVLALSNEGWLDAWDSSAMAQLTPKQNGVGAASPLIAACPAGPGRSFVAMASGAGTVIQLRDLTNAKTLDELHRVASGRVTAINSTDAWLAAAVDDPDNPRVELFRRRDGARTTIRLIESPRSVAVGLRGDRIAVLTDGGVAYAVRDANATRWKIGRLDRDAVTAVEFTPDGDRLMVGDETGQLAMLAIDPPIGDAPTRFKSRVVLTFTGHSDAVSVLQFATLDGRPTLLSGDRSGAVLVKKLSGTF